MKRPVPDEVILGLIKAKPTHGYELLESFRSRQQLGRIWTLSTSQLYAVLKRLEQAGAIIGRKIVSSNAPPRIEYEVTPSGETQLFSWLYTDDPSPSIHRIRVLFLSRIYIANLLGVSHRKIIDAQIIACESQKDKLISRSPDEISDIEKLTINYVVNQLDAAVRWLKESNFYLRIIDYTRF